MGWDIGWIAVAAFIVAGAVAWGPGLVMVVGGTAGGYAGAAMARKLDPRGVRRVVLVVAWGMTAYFFVKTYRPVLRLAREAVELRIFEGRELRLAHEERSHRPNVAEDAVAERGLVEVVDAG